MVKIRLTRFFFYGMKKVVRNIKSDGAKVYILFIYLSVGRGQMRSLLL